MSTLICIIGLLESELEAVSLMRICPFFITESTADSKLSVGVCKKLESADTENWKKKP